MKVNHFPVIDLAATGKNIIRLRKERGLTVRDLQAYFGFEEPQAIYKWQQGKSLPSVDNLYALGALLGVSMDEILVSRTPKLNLVICEQQAGACCSPRFWDGIISTVGDTAETKITYLFLLHVSGCVCLQGTDSCALALCRIPNSRNCFAIDGAWLIGLMISYIL